MKIHKEGWPLIIMSLVFALILGGTSFCFGAPPVLYWILTFIPVGFAIFFLCFFRDPKRTPTGDSHLITAPADGKVVIIQEVEEPEYFQGRPTARSSSSRRWRNPSTSRTAGSRSRCSCHFSTYISTGPLCREPYPSSAITGAATWPPGIPSPPPRTRGRPSYSETRTGPVFKNEDGTEVLCRQIAGLFARRVVCYAEYDRHFKAGEQIGFIKFGSRADVFLPLGTKVNVKVGDKVTGSETVIAELQKNTNN